MENANGPKEVGGIGGKGTPAREEKQVSGIKLLKDAQSSKARVRKKN